ncbi:MAG: hypothetical protein ACLT98_16685 [Eggerthellaceae bacterium]
MDALEKALLGAMMRTAGRRSGWRRSRTVPIRAKARTMITTQIDDLVGGREDAGFLYVLCGLAEAAVYVALFPQRSLIAGDYVAAGIWWLLRRWRCWVP